MFAPWAGHPASEAWLSSDTTCRVPFSSLTQLTFFPKLFTWLPAPAKATRSPSRTRPRVSPSRQAAFVKHTLAPGPRTHGQEPSALPGGGGRGVGAGGQNRVLEMRRPCALESDGAGTDPHPLPHPLKLRPRAGHLPSLSLWKMGLCANRIRLTESMPSCVPNASFMTVILKRMVINLPRMWTISDWIGKVLAPSQKVWVCIPALTHISSGIRVWPCFHSETLFIHR